MNEAGDAGLDAFLGLIAEKGFSDVALRDVAAAAGMGFAGFYESYPDKVSLIAAFCTRVDAQVLAGTASSIDEEETVRDRLFDVMMRRYDALRPHRAALRAIRGAVARDPFLALSTRPVVQRSMAAMLEAAGLPSEGLAGALRRNGLLAVHYAVSRVFDRDETADLSKTMAALDNRLKSVERWAQLIGKYTKSRKSEEGGQSSVSPSA